ncbi:hypothetical protein XM38_049650 [Halomicronema hongdechloris C2206]|uniref:Uncharacterized protein n=1 Tax=Halomicronema hongdechloris C2206 TaxID=1641165 RepID=A0A1Z3HUJ5_9CYAN|nr:hypothetical protein XM38_049650 [Halomicronema hongdechloris C2206]
MIEFNPQQINGQNILSCTSLSLLWFTRQIEEPYRLFADATRSITTHRYDLPRGPGRRNALAVGVRGERDPLG